MTWGKRNKEREKDNQGSGNQGGGNQGGGGKGGKSNGGQGGNKNKNKKDKDKEDKDDKDETVIAVGAQENTVKYCFKCGDPQHFARDCKKTGSFSCPIHKNETSHDKLACFLWRKVNNISVVPRPPSKERKN